MDAAPSSAKLVSTVLDLDAEIATLQERRKLAADSLIALGAGKYLDTSGERAVSVIMPEAPAAKFELYSKEALAAFLEKVGAKKPTPAQAEAFFKGREEGARELAGITFGKLFVRRVSFVTVKGFADIVPKLLTPAKARDLLDFCRIQAQAATAYLKTK
jgi:hypothetical protein